MTSSMKTSDVTFPGLLGAYIPEPLLSFAHGGLHENPKSGLARYGPLSLTSDRVSAHPDQVRVGMIGTATTIAASSTWLSGICDGVVGDSNNPEFPGFRRDRGFFSDLRFNQGWNERLTQSEVATILRISGQRARFEALVELVDDKLRL